LRETILQTKVSDLMTKNVIHSVSPDATIEKAAQRMKQLHCGCLVVISRGKLVGIVTERDLVQRVIAEAKSFRRTLVSQIMSKPVITIAPDATVSDAAKLMLKNGIRRLAVSKGSRLVGMLTTTDYAKYLSEIIRREPMLLAAARVEYQTIFE
jgi:CBS domain-containing protein